MKKIVVVIPIYHNIPTPFEFVSLVQGLSVFNYSIRFIYPEGLPLIFYKKHRMFMLIKRILNI